MQRVKGLGMNDKDEDDGDDTRTHNKHSTDSKKEKQRKKEVACCCVADHIRDNKRTGRGRCIRTNRFEVGLRCIVQLLQGDPLGLCLVGQGVVVLVHATLLRLAHLLAGPLLLREGE